MTKWKCESQNSEDTNPFPFTTIQENDDPRVAFLQHLAKYCDHIYKLDSNRSLYKFGVLFHTIASERIDLYEAFCQIENQPNLWQALQAKQIPILAFNSNDDDLHAHKITRLTERENVKPQQPHK